VFALSQRRTRGQRHQYDDRENYRDTTQPAHWPPFVPTAGGRVRSGDVNAGSHDSTTGDTPVTGGFLSEQPKRRTFESVLARLVATAGIVGIGTALGAILIAADVAGWITGLVVSIVTVALAAMLWRSRRL
jgi:hypothetical protein